jgi:hypothetical protein
MGHLHHANAKTTARTRQEIRNSQESIAALAKRYGINPKTVLYWKHADRVCHENETEHKLTKIQHPWTNGQVERMNRTIKDATVKKYYYQSHHELKQHLQTFLMAYNFAKRLKALKGLTVYEYICKIWTKEPERFRINPFHHIVGLNR